MLAHLLVGVVPAVINPVAQRGGQGAVFVLALKLAFLADAGRAGGGLVVAVLAVFFAVALPVPRHASVVLAFGPAAVLQLGAVGDAGTLVGG